MVVRSNKCIETFQYLKKTFFAAKSMYEPKFFKENLGALKIKNQRFYLKKVKSQKNNENLFFSNFRNHLRLFLQILLEQFFEIISNEFMKLRDKTGCL